MSRPPKVMLQAGDVLIVVDLQKDFLARGRFAVPRAGEVIPVLNRYLARFTARKLPVFATRDWHPVNHRSFQTERGRWPVHCVANSDGAQFAPGLILPPWTVVISKGTGAEEEACSAFEGTGLEQRLRGHAISRLFVGGLAAEYAVLNTVKDALARGFDVLLLRDAVRALNVHRRDGRNTRVEMLRLGAVPLELKDLQM